MKTFTITGDAGYEEIRARIAAHGSSTGAGSDPEKMAAARQIVEAVRDRGDAAVASYTARFDGVELSPAQFEVMPDEMDEAVARLEPRLLDVIRRAHRNIERFHNQHLRESWEETFEDGSVLGQRITPIESAGVYVPGGKAFYPSSVLMNIVPARVAGVREIIMVSPPSFHGSIHPAVLAAARIAGATRVFRIGGAQSIAALAYGTRHIPAVSKITGPGNTFVTLAKSLVRHQVEIDSEAGPSEVVVLADAHASASYVAAELLAQAEHDEEALPVLITESAALAAAVTRLVQEGAARLPRRKIIEAAIANNGLIIVTRNAAEATALTNLYAPEHLSIQTREPRATAAAITDAGAMMLGAMTPVAVGDYFAGPNHILPTGRRARYSSPLTAEDFRKVTSVLEYSEARLRADGEDIIAFAEAEELQAHARSITVRLGKDES